MNCKPARGAILPMLLFIALIAGNAPAITFTGSGGDGSTTFNALPDACLEVVPKSGPAPLFVVIHDCSRYADDITFVWELGVGGEDSEDFFSDEPEHSVVGFYPFPGTYQVFLEASNEFGSDFVVETIEVTGEIVPPPVTTLDFIASPKTGPPGTEVTFIPYSDYEVTSYLWDFGDGTGESSTDKVAHEYVSAGFYTVTLTAVIPDLYPSFREVQKPFYITISGRQAASALSPDFIASPATGSPPHLVQFSNLSGWQASNVLWDFGDGTTSSLLNPKHLYWYPGRYTVSLTMNGEAATKAECINVLATVSDQQCPAALILNNDESQLATVRAFRDNVLSQTVVGKGLMELYYKHSLEMVSILGTNPGIRQLANSLLVSLLPRLQAAADGEELKISRAHLDAARDLATQISAQAGAELQEVLVKMIVELESGELLTKMGAVVTP